MRAWLLLTVLAACEKSSPAPAPEPDRDLLLSGLAADMVTYAQHLPGITLAFDGDCSAHAARLLTIEPLVSSIRSRAAGLSSEETRSVRERMAARKQGIFDTIDAELAEMHVSAAEFEAKDAAITAACANDPKVKDALDRINLFKKAP